jgi:D-serine deaminase-like pyridoxal phosphate-dependent protein
MSGRPALSSEASSPRLLVLDGETSHEVFDVITSSDAVIRVRSALLFEVGEQLELRIEHAGSVWQATARVRGHAGTEADQITELEISDRRAVSA